CTLPSLSRAHNPGYVKCHRYIQQALIISQQFICGRSHLNLPLSSDRSPLLQQNIRSSSLSFGQRGN
ncbi:hypothetical protein, partial [Microcoleus sp. D3_18_C4]|uniref:hypothetical protein n=1 Tax=Microcoleus sp. D3_18_C4 TaxID=3055335 RepID=UPI002FD6478D